MFGPALERLRNDESRAVAIDIDIDSLSFVDEQIRANETATVSQTILGGFQNIAQVMGINPQAGAVLLRVLMHMLEVTPTGRDIQEETKNVVDAMIEQAMQPPPQAPPPPDYEMMKLQLQGQKQQMDGALKSRELEQKEMKLALESQVEGAKHQLDTFKAQLDQMGQQFLMQMESIRVQIEQYKAQAQVAESAQEERRLAEEVSNQRFVALLEAQKPQPPIIPPPAPVNITVEASKPAKRKGYIQYTDQGAELIVEEEVPGLE